MKKPLRTVSFWTVTVLLWELVLHLVIWRGVSARALNALPFSLSLALFLTLLSRLWPGEKANRITGYVLILAFAFVFSVQTVYYKIFSTLLTFTLVGVGGDAIADFFDITVNGTLRSLPFIVLYFLPAAVMALMFRRKVLDSAPVGAWRGTVLACASILVFAVGVPSEGSGTARSEAYYELNTSIDRQTEYFGLITAERLELKRLGSDATGLVTDVMDITSHADGPADGADTGDAEVEPPLPPALNVMEKLDLDALLKAADTGELRDLTRYFSTLGGTEKNEYTGLFEGFNVIEICAESYFRYAVDRERTPTLYKLTHEGIVFDNFYGSFPNTTTNGEFSFSMGLMPDKNRSSFTLSISDYLPFTLARMLRPLGVTPRAYHNNTAYYYGRINSHTNMGYEFRAIDFGLELSPNRPYSDLEMMEKTVDDYIGDDRFLAYYMTFSGHSPYDFEKNTIAAKNRDKVEDAGGSEAVRAYLAGQMELEYALRYLMDRLEEACLLDRTVIVLTGDHFPYALTTEDLAYLAGEETVAGDPFWQYRNSFICWSGAIEEPIHVDSFCCTQDVLPTLLNLLGLEFDSRLLTGTDVLSNSTHMAVFFDGSFRTKDLYYDANTGKVTYITDREDLPEGYADKLRAAVNNQFSVSASILRNDYYGFAFRTLGLSDARTDDTGKYTLIDLEGKWYADEAETLVREGVITGHSEAFHGEDSSSVAELATMLVKAFDFPLPEDADRMPFTDVSPEDWEYDPIARLWGAGFLEDTDKCHCREPASREFTEKIVESLAVYAGLPEGDTSLEEVLEGVFGDYEANGGDPAVFTRGAAAALVVRLRDALDR